MADQYQLDILRQGQDVWNTWRQQNPEILPDLSNADLSNADLSDTDLSQAHLSQAHLSGAKLYHADLRTADLNDADLSRADFNDADLIHADLSRANLSLANLSGADLTYADLSDADLSRANLSDANLSGAYLIRANLTYADFFQTHLSDTDLSHANLSGASVGWTQFNDIDLCTVRGLETVKHRSPSSIGIDTIYRSKGHIPDAFLRKAGVPEDFLTYIRTLIAHPIEYYTCFISYSSRDQAFADRLYADLQSEGVRCWFAPEDMKTGDKIRQRIDESIHLYDKLLLVLSEHSITSSWVEFEVEAAFAKEDEKHTLVLFPVRLDHTVMQCTTSWAAHLKRMRHITDFTSWKQFDNYQNALTRLLRDLKAETPPKKNTT